MFPLPMCHSIPELASSQASLEEEEAANKRVVKLLYEALNSRDVDTVHRLLAPHIEWWFHGPTSHHHHMMRLLSGTASPKSSFIFKPISVIAFGSTVLVEGQDSVPWVHVWTFTDGIITQLREYFNTSLTVTRLGNSNLASPSSPPSIKCQSIWQSELSGNSSVPGLVLAL